MRASLTRDILPLTVIAFDALFKWVELSAVSVWVRESTDLYAFPGILALHTIGMGFVAGMSTATALRILGIARFVPLLELKKFFPILWIGFWLNAVSGVFLLIAYPTKALTNPVFYLKLAFIAMAVWVFQILKQSVFIDSTDNFASVPKRGKLWAVASLACWAGAIFAGRFLAYTYSKLLSISGS